MENGMADVSEAVVTGIDLFRILKKVQAKLNGLAEWLSTGTVISGRCNKLVSGIWRSMSSRRRSALETEAAEILPGLVWTVDCSMVSNIQKIRGRINTFAKSTIAPNMMGR